MSLEARRVTNPAPTNLKGLTPEFIPPLGDIQTVSGFTKEVYRRHFPPIVYEPLLRDEGVVDSLYNEQREKTFGPPILVHAQVTISPPILRLVKYGIDEARDALFIFSTHLLAEKGIELRPGDRITWDSHHYEVMTMHPDDYWYNFNVPFSLAVPANRYRVERL